MNKYLNKKKAILLLIVLSVYVIIITPLLIVNLRQQQEIRGRAFLLTSPSITPFRTPLSAPAYTATTLTAANQYQNTTSCGKVPADIIIILDRSGSMAGTKFTEAKTAAKNFINVVSADNINRISLVSFSKTATLDSTFTTNYSAVKSKIDTLTTGSGTCHECAVVKANQEISANGRAGVKKVIVLLTDGKANYIIGGTSQSTTAIAEQKALTAVQAGFNASKTVFFTIGFGIDGQTGNSGYNGQFLEKIAMQTGGKHYYPAPGELEIVYNEISLLIGKGLLGGFVFNDINGNAAFDLNEPKLNNWSIQLISSSNTQTFTADANGAYTITGLCDGNYQLKQIIKSGWMQTLPSNNSSYNITIANGNSFTDKLFGNKVAPTATPTQTPSPTPKPRCSDGIDNDNNGLTDTGDSSCHTDANPNNPSSYDPNKNGEQGGGNTCADSKDNNGNNLIDGADPVCHTDKNANNPGSYDRNLPEINPPTSTLTPTPKPSSSPTPTASPTPSSSPTPISSPTPNPTPADTFLSLKVFHHGVWNSGDNTNPTQTDLSNKNPIHKTVNVNMELFNTENQLIGQGQGPLTYNTTDGNFQGKIGIYPNSFPTGKYYLKVKTDYHLKRIIPGILTITSEQINNVPAVTLVTGDSNNDNQISILDYNRLLDCYSDLTQAVACDPDKKTTTDFNDDTFVNQIDYNLFLREIATQPGQ